MKSLPLPVRVAAGLAVTAVEQARTLPAKLAGLPVTVASQALQVSMRVQQQVTELAIRGDEVLASLRPVEETPAWATFDEDLDEDGGRYESNRPSAFDQVDELDLSSGNEPDPWDAEELALAEETESHGVQDGMDDLAGEVTVGDFTVGGFSVGDSSVGDAAVDAAVGDAAGDAVGEAAGGSVVAAENYDELSLPQLRARLRRFSVAQLTELLDYERAHANRPSYVGMLARRIATVRDQR